jgi:hypothetical protein
MVMGNHPVTDHGRGHAGGILQAIGEGILSPLPGESNLDHYVNVQAPDGTTVTGWGSTQAEAERNAQAEADKHQ